jgi:hypothetical protein
LVHPDPKIPFPLKHSRPLAQPKTTAGVNFASCLNTIPPALFRKSTGGMVGADYIGILHESGVPRLFLFLFFADVDNFTALEMSAFGANGVRKAHLTTVAALNQVDRF